ncbi:MAG: cephalosporin-C deacetylase [Pseudonocardiales bacterium]|jgi:cephalosporin-C deacetylase|nr:cephalosporin-C deacetylase [Pseudonocardiales bacterium]
MPLYDMPLAEMRCYDPQNVAPNDLALFWQNTLAEAGNIPIGAEFTPVDTGLQLIETFDVSYAGFDGDVIRGWLHLPVHRSGRLPVVVQYIGYGGGRGLPHENVLWAMAGYAHFVMDTRGQGSGSSVGATEDNARSGPASPGCMTRGIANPADYYYRRLFTDAVRAVDAAHSHQDVDPSRTFVEGGSQGGGLALAVAALRPDLAGVMADVPFLSDFRRAVDITERDPYAEVARYLKIHRDQIETVFHTLSYFDVSILVRTATAPALISVALMDQVCPPSTVFAAYNAYPGERELRIYHYNDHEGGGALHEQTKLGWLADRLG